MRLNIMFFVAVVCTFVFWSQGFRAAWGLGPSLDDVDVKALVVVELFTSQSCSSCPSADKVLQELSKHESVIALGCHVTYWNHLHWKDTLSKPDCTNRQHAYANYQKSRRVYTPQMVVNGQDFFVGSYRSQVKIAIEKATPIARIDVAIEDGILTVGLPEAGRASYALMVLGTKKDHVENIPSGENRGRVLRYSNSVILMESAGVWDGVAQTQSIEIGDTTNLDHIVVLAQRNGFGAIIAAGRLAL